MRHAESTMAAMCHCLLATDPMNKPLHENDKPFCYMNHAFDEMLKYFGKAGIGPKHLEVKAFGGADVLKAITGRRTVGRGNIDYVHSLVSKHGIHLMASDMGGQVGRRIVFKTETGSVMVRRLGQPSDQI